MSLVSLDLLLSVECTCTGPIHTTDCHVQSRLPIISSAVPNRWLIQFGRFLVRDELFNPDLMPLIPYKQFREFSVQVKPPVKKNSKEEGTYFVDIELSNHAKNYIDWLVNQLEKNYGQIKYQNRLHLVLTTTQWNKLESSVRSFTQFKATVRGLVLVRGKKYSQNKIPLKESDIMWQKRLRPTADTTIQSMKNQVVHSSKKQCLVGCFLVFLFAVIVPAILITCDKLDII